MSLNRRIIISATLVLVVFITLVAATLDRAFVDSTETALRDRLTSQLYALMASAEVESGEVFMPSGELDVLLGLPSSGMYASILDRRGKVLWRSSSALGAETPPAITLNSGEKRFDRVDVDDAHYYTLAYGVNWASDTGDLAITFNIATDLKTFNKQIYRYRKTLWGWLVAMAVLLLISQAIILRWGLSPLRRVGHELNRIESGEQEQIQDSYPQEIERLTDNINKLLQQEREQKTRYRNALGDLAHSLKTPLAVMQSSANVKQDETVQQQIAQMNSIVEYQLQRAATAGSTNIGRSIDVRNVLHRILESLSKVYHDKPVQVNIDVTEGLVFKGDEGDMMELLGNLLDNAYKWTDSRIDVTAAQQDGKLRICVSDDGPGFQAGQIDELLQRGKRADQTTAGHGIGLSIVQNIVLAYHGELNITTNEAGGADVIVLL